MPPILPSNFKDMVSWKVLLTHLALKLSIVILILASAFESGQQLSKFIAGKTTIAGSVEKHSVQTFPAISICPGYRNEEVAKYPWLLTTWNGYGDLADWYDNETSVIAESPDEVQEIWDKVTYDPGDFVLGLQLDSFQWGSPTVLTREQILSGNSSQIVWVERHDTYCGKCYTFRVSEELRTRQYLTIWLNLTALGGVESLPWYFHHAKAGVMLNGGYTWIGPIFSAVSRANSFTVVDLVKESWTTSPSLFQVTTEEDFFDCVYGRIKMYLEKSSAYLNPMCNEKNKTSCYFPLFAGLLDLVNKSAELPTCIYTRDFFCSLMDIQGLLEALKFPTVCPSITSKTTYSANVNEDSTIVITEKGTSFIAIAFKSTDVTVHEELPLMDWFDLVSAVGGIVGIFLGWSIRDLVGLAKIGMKKVGTVE